MSWWCSSPAWALRSWCAYTPITIAAPASWNGCLPIWGLSGCSLSRGIYGAYYILVFEAGRVFMLSQVSGGREHCRERGRRRDAAFTAIQLSPLRDTVFSLRMCAVSWYMSRLHSPSAWHHISGQATAVSASPPVGFRSGAASKNSFYISQRLSDNSTQ